MPAIGLATTNTTVYAPVTPIQVISNDLTSKEDIVAYIRTKNWDHAVAIAVMMAESQGNSKAYNPEWHRTCQGSYGLFQVACMHFEKGDDKLSAKTNIDTAYKVYKQSGFKPWTTFTSGAYLAFL